MVAYSGAIALTEKPLGLQPHLAMPPAIDATERFLMRLFLRRYITWCARRIRGNARRGVIDLSRSASSAVPPDTSRSSGDGTGISVGVPTVSRPGAVPSRVSPCVASSKLLRKNRSIGAVVRAICIERAKSML
jgi:hypothetical protein